MSMKKNEEAAKNLRSAENVYLESYRLVDDCHKLMNSMTNIGVDICSYDHSWAVVCVKGHPEYVKFMELSNKDTREIIDYLNHFKYSNLVIDSPNHIIMNPFYKGNK